MQVLYVLGFAVFGYLLGSIPTGYWLGKMKGIDVRTIGSGATGGTNVIRAMGKKSGFLVIFVDLLKGLIPSAVAYWFFTNHWFVFAAILGAGTGSIFSFILYLSTGSFKAGKGVATFTGGMIPVFSWVVAPIIAGWFMMILFWRSVRKKESILNKEKVALAGLVTVFFIPLALWFYQDDWVYRTLGFLIVPIILFSHRENIGRLWRGIRLRGF